MYFFIFPTIPAIAGRPTSENHIVTLGVEEFTLYNPGLYFLMPGSRGLVYGAIKTTSRDRTNENALWGRRELPPGATGVLLVQTR